MWKFQTYAASWFESFDALKADSIKLLLLLSLRRLLGVYLALLQAWFLPVALIVGLVLNIPSLLAAFYSTLIIRAARPSLEYKNAQYWQQTLFADWIVFLAVLVLAAVPHLMPEGELYFYLSGVGQLIMRIFFLTDLLCLPGTCSFCILTLFFSPFFIVWILFMLDTKNSVPSVIKAFGRAVLMIAANYPFFIVVYGIFRVVLSLGYLATMPLVQAMPTVPSIGWIVLLGLVVPYYICLLSNFYVKRLHEQFSLYYGK